MMEHLPSRSERPVVPLDEAERRLFAISGAAQGERRGTGVIAWKSYRYDPLSPVQSPKDSSKKVRLRIRAMVGERRADTFVLQNASALRRYAFVRLVGVPEEVHARIEEVPFVDSSRGLDIASALVEARKERDGWPIDLEAGMNHQIWVKYGRIARF